MEISYQSLWLRTACERCYVQGILYITCVLYLRALAVDNHTRQDGFFCATATRLGGTRSGSQRFLLALIKSCRVFKDQRWPGVWFPLTVHQLEKFHPCCRCYERAITPCWQLLRRQVLRMSSSESTLAFSDVSRPSPSRYRYRIKGELACNKHHV